jgi:non-specific serine/threonine protein kinase
VLHGGTAVKERARLVKTFQEDPTVPFFVLSLKAGGTGLNLTAAQHVVHLDRWWNPAVEDQATDRAYRIGQRRNVLVHRFVCRGTVEERVAQMLDEKRAVAGAVLAGPTAPEVPLTELSDRALLDLVSLDLARALDEG